MLDGLTISRCAFERTVRLVSSDEIDALAEIEGATSHRLAAQDHGAEGIGSTEFVYGVPFASFINASFAYAKPSELNRFNAACGAWYAALDVETCKKEVAFDMADFLAKSGSYVGVVEYAEMLASLAGEYVDLRPKPDHRCLDPNPTIGYPIGNAVADAARAKGINGIIFPSARHTGGTCFVALLPHAVQSAAQGAIYRFEWSGGPGPAITKVSD